MSLVQNRQNWECQFPGENRQEKEKTVVSIFGMDFQWSKNDMPDSFSAFNLIHPLFFYFFFPELSHFPFFLYISPWVVPLFYLFCLLMKLSSPLGLWIFKAGGKAWLLTNIFKNVTTFRDEGSSWNTYR